MKWIRQNVKSFLRKNLTSNFKINLILSNPTELDQKVIRHALGGWSIDPQVAEVLMQLIYEFGITRVVEIGAGYSSIIFHHAVPKVNSDFEVFSIEENVDWFKIPKVLESIVDRKEMKFHTGKLMFTPSLFGVHATYKIPSKHGLKPGVELVFVDGPQYYFGREGGLDEIYSKLKVGCWIVMDDAERYAELCVIYKWLKVYRGLDLIYLNERFGTKGLAILRVNKPLKRRFSVLAYALGLMQGLKRVANFNKIREKQSYLKSQAIS